MTQPLSNAEVFDAAKRASEMIVWTLERIAKGENLQWHANNLHDWTASAKFWGEMIAARINAGDWTA